MSGDELHDYAYQTDMYACRGETNLQLGHVLAARGQIEAAANAASADNPCQLCVR